VTTPAAEDPAAEGSPPSRFELEEKGPLLGNLEREAAAGGLYLIARARSRRTFAVVVNNGRTEEIGSSASMGLGLHLFTEAGVCAFGSIDGLDDESAAAMLARTARAACSAGSMGAAANLGFLTAAPLRARVGEVGRVPIDSVSIAEVEKQALQLNEEAKGMQPGLSARTALSFEREEWRVARSDGTDVAWVVTRFVASQSLTAEGSGGAFTCRAAVPSPHYDALRDEAVLRRLQLRTRSAAQRARALPQAARFASGGAVPLLIDYALAKGLAHEAFGHAAEADQFRSSILAREGRFRCGERVGREGVSVIDEPIAGDHADQPVSANGERRQRVEIVRSGLLAEALTDLFSARAAGHPSKGSDRAGSYRAAPLPRMSNIRIEIAGPRPLPLPFEEMTPENVRDLIGDAGLFERYPRVIFLSGYTGGQVNPVQGDFLFNCQALYELAPGRVALHRPSAFRGTVLAALGSLSTGFGPLCLDAIGMCGKWGQSVPSCGGSHAFVFIEPDPSIRVGS